MLPGLGVTAMSGGGGGVPGASAILTDAVVSASATTHNLVVNTGLGGIIALGIGLRSGATGRTITSVTFDPSGVNISATQQEQQDHAAGGSTVRAEVWSAAGVPADTDIPLRVVCSAASVIGVAVYQLNGAASATKTHSAKGTSTTAPSVNADWSAQGTLIAVACAERTAGVVAHTWSGAAGLSVADYTNDIDGANGANFTASHRDQANAGVAQSVTDTFHATALAGSLVAVAFA